jgi:hypothetical protein
MDEKPTCSVMGCGNPVIARGLCVAHYRRLQRTSPPGVRVTARHQELLASFGGMRAFCRAVGIHSPVVYRWKDGEVPEIYHGVILDGAARYGLDVERVRRALGGV